MDDRHPGEHEQARESERDPRASALTSRIERKSSFRPSARAGRLPSHWPLPCGAQSCRKTRSPPRRERNARCGATAPGDGRVELWRLTKGAHIAAAEVRGVAGVELELRLLYDGELRRSQVYRLADDLESEAGAKRLELQGRGWQ
jgi:hypothetical protein